VSATGIGDGLAGKAADGRRLIAIVYADMVGYSRLIGLDDAGTLDRLRTLRRALIDPAIREHGGRVVQTGGDSLLMAFDSIDGAVRCAVRIQRQIADHDGDQPPDRRIRFRIGVNIGDVIPDGTDVHGEGVNVAARLESECPVGGICVSRAVRDHVHGRLGLEFEPVGELTLKNIARPVEAFIVRPDAGAGALVSATVQRARPRARLRARAAWVGVTAVLICLGLGNAGWWLHRETSNAPPPDVATIKAPRLSIVVLPLENLGGDPEFETFVNGVTEDLTTGLARRSSLPVTARNTAFVYKGKPIDIVRVGRELGVRYVLEGSIRKVGVRLRVNAQLVSTETGAHLWADQFDVEESADGAAQGEIALRLSNTLWRQLIDIESARSARERPDNPDATDSLLQAFALDLRPASLQQQTALASLYERAMQLNPQSADALAGYVQTRLNIIIGTGETAPPEQFARLESLVARGEALQPRSLNVMFARAYLLRTELRLREALAAYKNFVDTFPTVSAGQFMVGNCLFLTGDATEAIPYFRQAIKLAPQNPGIMTRYLRLGQAQLILGRYDEAVDSIQRVLGATAGNEARWRAHRYLEVAAAHAFAGRIEEARAAAAEATRLWPVLTVRGWWGQEEVNPMFVAQLTRIEPGLRIAGLRDHADEDADFGLVADDVLHREDEGRTPTTAPGVRTIGTAALANFLEEQKPLLLDVSARITSVPGAIGLLGAGRGDSVSDPLQDRLARKLQQLTGPERARPIVTLAWNADRFSGRNLALRLVALGYTNVFWYRGGREAWEVADQRVGPVDLQDW
jgi:TolB-like protein/class 3 adenylate cyclase/TolA-binding protein